MYGCQGEGASQSLSRVPQELFAAGRASGLDALTRCCNSSGQLVSAASNTQRDLLPLCTKGAEDSCSRHTVCAHHHSWAGHAHYALLMLCPCVCAGARTLDRERQRMSFFQSLRKGATNGGASSPQQLDAALNTPEVAAGLVPSKAEAAASEQLKSAEPPTPAANGHLSSIQEHSELLNGVAKQDSPRRQQQQVRLCRGQVTLMLLQQLGT